MSATVKVNLALWGAVIATLISVGSVLIGAGVFMANQATHRRDIDKNSQAIEVLKTDIDKKLDRIVDQMRQDKAEVLQAIRDTR